MNELQRLEATRFFDNKPHGMSKASYLYEAALREAKRWGQMDPLANKYAALAAQARKAGV